MSQFLSQFEVSSLAPAKTILVGEHAAVYGFPAIAMALPDVTLKITLSAPDHSSQNTITDWDSAWHIYNCHEKSNIESRVRKLLSQALQKALQLCGFQHHIAQYAPQQLTIQSDIPLGGGMGGSAAISTALLRMAARILNVTHDFEQEANLANEIDCLFHAGQASGLDTAAIASSGIIQFQKGQKNISVTNKSTFWIALIDSMERSETSMMIQKVAQLMKASPDHLKSSFEKIGNLALKSKKFIEEGKLNELAIALNEAHQILKNLTISTQTIDHIVSVVKKNGALAAKLTGAGGGGLVLSLFTDKPAHLYDIFPNHRVFISCIQSISN